MKSASPEPMYCPHCRTLNARSRAICCECRMPLAPTAVDTPFGRPGGVLLRPMVPDSRTRKRRGVRIEGVVVQGGGVIQHRVTVWNIHETGLQFRTPFEYTVGAKINIRLPLEGRLFILRARVRYVGLVVGEREKTWACGVEFLESNAALATEISRLEPKEDAA